MSNTDTAAPSLLRIARGVTWCLEKSVTSLNALGTLIIIAMMALICADVVGRNLLATSLPGIIELTELGIVSIVFLQIADTLRTGKLMRSDALIRMIIQKRPSVGAIMNACFDATGAVLFYYIAKGAFERFSEAWSGGYYLGNQGSFTAPTWPMELCVSLGSTLMCLLFIVSVIRSLAFLFGLASNPQDQIIQGGQE